MSSALNISKSISSDVPEKIPEDILVSMMELPFFDWYKKETRTLTLEWATRFPEEYIEYAPYIEWLEMPNYREAMLPWYFTELTSLKRLFFFNHNFTTLPRLLWDMSLELLYVRKWPLRQILEWWLSLSLKWLQLSENPHLKKLPYSTKRLEQLQKWAFVATWIEQYEDYFLGFEKLDLFRTAGSETIVTPSWVWEHWNIAFFWDQKDNYSQRTQNILEKSTSPEYKWEDLYLTWKKLWESPSSDVFLAIVKATQQKVAVKIFKTGLSSDGYPEADKNAAMVVWLHDNIVPILWELQGHSEGKSGIVLWVIPEEYKDLWNPPDFQTISRDTFSDKQIEKFSSSFMLQAAIDISAALAHMHSRGVAHGDMYAHNIRINNQWKAYLLDFWAASVYDKEAEPWREKQDVRAFGYLLDDMLTQSFDTSWPVWKLWELRQLCLWQHVMRRPSFEEIWDFLNNI